MENAGVFGFLSRRTNFLSTGVRLCWIIAAICSAALAVVAPTVPWVALWLLVLMTIIILGTFGIWAFHAVKNPQLLDSEEHTEQMGTISTYGRNNLNEESFTVLVDPSEPRENPRLAEQAKLANSSEGDDD